MIQSFNIVLVAGCIVGLVSDCKAAPDGLQIEGTVLYTAYRVGVPEPILSNESRFSIVVLSPNWKIWTSTPEEGHDYRESGTDGDKSYYYCALRRAAEERIGQGIDVTNNAVATVNKGVIPQGAPLLHRVLWIAFCSGSYLGQRTNQTIEMLHPPTSGSQPGAWRGMPVGASWKLAGGAVPMPSYLATIDSGVIPTWETTASSWAIPPAERKWPAPFGDGFTNMTYGVSEWFDGDKAIVCPRAAKARFFSPNLQETAKGEQHQGMAFEISVKSVIPVSSPIAATAAYSVPVVKGVALVMDRRFARDEQPLFEVSYMAKDRWLSDGELRETAAYLEAQVNQGIQIRHVQSTQRRTFIIRLIIISAMVCLSAWAAFRMFHRSVQTK